jgi:uncharacterized membrane protein YhaH (DUF805 family)
MFYIPMIGLTVFAVSSQNNIYMYLWQAFIIPMIWIAFVLYIKRLHDLDKSGWMSLLLLVPFANFYIWIICGFFKWTTGKNQFWEDPLGWKVGENEKVEL